MKNTGKIFKNLALITQLGLQVMVPIALCVAAGVIIDNHFGTCWVIPLMIIGMLAGGRNGDRLDRKRAGWGKRGELGGGRVI